MKDIKKFQIKESDSIKNAFKKIESNEQGVIVVIDQDRKVIGIATDGDIRRGLIQGHSVDDKISCCMNREFVRGKQHTERELLLKLLDQQIKIIPIISDSGQLVDIYSKNHFPLFPQEKIYARAKSPVRISFGGGGTDLTHYFVKNGGAVINATISLFSHSVLKKRDDKKIRIYSHDLREVLEGNNLNEILQQKGPFQLIISLLDLIHPDFGFNLEIGSEFPLASGLGGSAVVLSGIIGCFNEFRQDQWDRYEIAEIAFQAERFTMNMAGGWQDQYATTFGGFNFMEFNSNQNIIHPLRIREETLLELEESLVLCNTGISHQSGDIHLDQKETMGKKEIMKLVQLNKDLTYEIKNFLLRGRLSDFGRALHQTWMLKRQFSSQISNDELDDTYNFALENGATGGKLLGAGGGGFFLFYVPPFKKYQLATALESRGLKAKQFTFDNKGMQSWTARELKNPIE